MTASDFPNPMLRPGRPLRGSLNAAVRSESAARRMRARIWKLKCRPVDLMEKTIRLIIADDHAIVREGLKSLMRLEEDIEVVAEVERAGEIKAALAATPCDVLLLDLQMDEWAGDQIESLARLT